MKYLWTFHVFKYSNTIFTNQNIKKDDQHNVINFIDTALQNGIDSNKRGAVSWEESEFSDKKILEVECLCPN